MPDAMESLKRAQHVREMNEAEPDERFLEHPGLPAGTLLRCRRCESTAILYPARTVDPRWMIGFCADCKRRQIVDVLVPRQR